MGVVITLYMMRVICCYCGKDLGGKSCEPRMVNQVSHGTCKACDTKLRKRLGLSLETDETLLETLEANR